MRENDSPVLGTGTTCDEFWNEITGNQIEDRAAHGDNGHADGALHTKIGHREKFWNGLLKTIPQ